MDRSSPVQSRDKNVSGAAVSIVIVGYVVEGDRRN